MDSLSSTPASANYDRAVAELGTGLALKRDGVVGRQLSGQQIWEAMDSGTVLKAFDTVLEWCSTHGASADYFDGLYCFFNLLTGIEGCNSSETTDPFKAALFNLYLGPRVISEVDNKASNELIADLYLGTFRRVYHLARGLVTEIAALFDQPLTFPMIIHGCVRVALITSMVGAVAVRKRIASDSDFLAALVKYALLARREWDLHGATKRQLDNVSSILIVVLAEDRKPFCAKYATDLSLQKNFRDFGSLLQHYDWQSATELGKAVMHSTPGTLFYRDSKVILKSCRSFAGEDLFSQADSCDACLKKESADCKLKRCSRCLVARYCSSECQVADWKNGEAQGEVFQGLAVCEHELESDTTIDG